MIGTAFYALGVIVCMIAIVLTALAAIFCAVRYRKWVILLGAILGLAALASWSPPANYSTFLASNAKAGLIGAIVLGTIAVFFRWVSDQRSSKEMQHQDDRWKVLNSSWQNRHK